MLFDGPQHLGLALGAWGLTAGPRVFPVVRLEHFAGLVVEQPAGLGIALDGSFRVHGGGGRTHSALVGGSRIVLVRIIAHSLEDILDGHVSASPAVSDPGEADFRDEFPILSQKVYLNSNSLGALSQRSMAERREFERLWNEMGASAWYEIWLAKLDDVRAAFGRTIGADPGTVALMPSVSGGLAALSAAVAAHPERGKRKKVVLTELDFPTVGHHFLSRQATGLEVEIVPSPDGIHVPLEAIEAAVDENTALLATSHVFFTSGTVQDVPELARIAHQAGAFILLDVYQSNGQLPVDVRRLDVDFLLGGALKWLCGGPGMAYLYVRSEIQLDPVTLSWFGVENQFGFDIRDATPREDARRFELGTPAMGAAYTAAGGLSIVLEAGIEAIEARNRVLSEDIRLRLDAAGYSLHQTSDAAARSALVLIEHPDAAGAVRGLAERGVIVDHRGPLLRFSPHFYNTIQDNERALEALVAFDA